MRAVLRFVGRVVAVVVIVVGGAALAAGVLVPRLAGATPYVVLSDSMAPALPAGTLIIARPTDPAGIRIGDVVTYQFRSGESAVATHRVVGVGSTASGERTFVTQGDANNAADVEPVRAVQVQGRLWYFVPYLGHAGALLTGGQREVVTTGLVVLLLGYAGWQAAAALRERRRRRTAPAATPAAAESPGSADSPGAVRPPGAAGSAIGPTAVGIVLAVGLAGSVLAPSVQAHAAPRPAEGAPAVGLSLDGETWTRGSISPRFAQDLRWVPGDVEALKFYMRNESGSVAQGRAEVLVGTRPDALADALSFRTRLGRTAWSRDARSAQVTLAPGEVLPVSVEVAFAPEATNPTQRGQVPFDVRVTLTDPSAGRPVQGPDEPPSTGTGSLAPTGTTALPLLLLAAVAVLTGAALRRRRG